MADCVCNWILACKTDLSDLDLHDVAARLQRGEHLQIHSDGGYRNGCGAAAAVVLTYALLDGLRTPSVVGYWGAYIGEAKSAFHTELIAADVAIRKALEIGKLVSQ